MSETSHQDGGPLSHGSIVAREYGIPAVMGTGSATRHIRTGQMITVDGTSGTVTLGAVGGLYPAWRAANPSPVEALRHEQRRQKRIPIHLLSKRKNPIQPTEWSGG